MLLRKAEFKESETCFDCNIKLVRTVGGILYCPKCLQVYDEKSPTMPRPSDKLESEGDSRADESGEAEAEHEVGGQTDELENKIRAILTPHFDFTGIVELRVQEIMEAIRQSGRVTLEEEGNHANRTH